MIPLVGTVRVRGDGDVKLVGVDGGDLAPELARLTIETALPLAKLSTPGVYVVHVEGEPKKPTIRAHRIAEANQTVMVARVERQAEQAMNVSHVQFSPSESAPEDIKDRCEQALSEAAATASRHLKVGESRTIEIVM